VCGSVVKILGRGVADPNRCILRAEDATTRKHVEMMIIYTPATKTKHNYINIYCKFAKGEHKYYRNKVEDRPFSQSSKYN
jgi:hypothetical protein